MELIFGILVVILIYLYLSNNSNKNDKPLVQVKEKEIEKEIPKQQFELTDEFKEILEILKNTNESLFITGKAGTGKSSLLKHFIKSTNKKHVILAPTGIAALNVGGQTIHSFFRFQPSIVNSSKIEPDYVRVDLFKNLEMVIIDEISMVRVDLMNGIDIALRKNRNRLNEPFGGVQMVFIGDLFQLPPVVTEKDRDIILSTYGGYYFFDAPVFKAYNYKFKELTTIFRQSNEQPEFKKMLNNIRNNEADFDDMTLLNSRHKDNAGDQEDSIFLTTRKSIARNINNDKLENLKGEKFTYEGSLSGKYLLLKNEPEEKLEDKFPAPYKLELKKGVQIMMIKNDSGKRWVNGSIGKVDKLEKDSISISIDNNKYTIEKEIWNEVEYVLNKETKEIEEKIVAGFSQFPLQLAYAMTIHKSQGKTFDKITVDIGTGAFAHGQIYVALSRCRSINGIILNNAIKNSDIIVDPRIIEFYKTKNIPKQILYIPEPRKLDTKSIKDDLSLAIMNKQKIKIQYENFNGETSERIISDLKLTEEFNEFGYENQHIKGFCHLRNEERSFKIDRIRNIELVK